LGPTAESATGSPPFRCRNLGRALNAQTYAKPIASTALPSLSIPAPLQTHGSFACGKRASSRGSDAPPFAQCLPRSPHNARMFPSNTRFSTAFPQIHPKPTESPIHIFRSVQIQNPRQGDRRNRSKLASERSIMKFPSHTASRSFVPTATDSAPSTFPVPLSR